MQTPIAAHARSFSHVATFAVQLEPVRRQSLGAVPSATATFEQNVLRTRPAHAPAQNTVPARSEGDNEAREPHLISAQFGRLALKLHPSSPRQDLSAMFSPGLPLPSPARVRADQLEAAMPRGGITEPLEPAGALRAKAPEPTPPASTLTEAAGVEVETPTKVGGPPLLPEASGPLVPLPEGVLWFPVGVTFADLEDAADFPPEYAYTVTGARRRVRSAEARPILGRRVCVNDRSIAVFKFRGGLLAFDADCPHAGGAFELGDIEEYGGATCVCCPRHGFLFDVRPLQRGRSVLSAAASGGVAAGTCPGAAGPAKESIPRGLEYSTELVWKGSSVSPPQTFCVGVYPTGVHTADGTIYVGFGGLSPSAFSGAIDF